jgi:hypothetical protein
LEEEVSIYFNSRHTGRRELEIFDKGCDGGISAEDKAGASMNCEDGEEAMD